jgi:hypothetical protein
VIRFIQVLLNLKKRQRRCVLSFLLSVIYGILVRTKSASSQFLERTQESNDISPAQHADDIVIAGDGELVDSIEDDTLAWVKKPPLH